VKGIFQHQAPAAGAQLLTLAQYRQIEDFRGMNPPQPAAPGAAPAGPARVNPWHPNVDDVMFYL
jgi:hypothetical protein